MKQELLQQAVPLLLDWYRQNKRSMPWRDEPTPYHVWVSEIMLQQTRIEAAMPYYARFLDAFPDIAALAQADDERLMKEWQGLGYYSRARNLKKAAITVVEEFDGKLPEQAEKLEKLPGIGAYTAGAIASIAYGQPAPAVDGNVLRVLMRLFADKADVMQPKTRKEITELLKTVYPTGESAADLTQGLMELGEVICLPNSMPRCEECPWKTICKAHEAGNETEYPVRIVKTKRKIENRAVLLIRCGDRYALCQRPKTGLLAGMWEFPHFELQSLDAEKELQIFLREKEINSLAVTPIGNAKHLFSHIEWRMTGFQVECSSESDVFVWATADEIQNVYAVPSAFRAHLKRIGWRND